MGKPQRQGNDEALPVDSGPGATLAGESRAAMGVVAVLILVLSAWMFWIVRRFLGGQGWFDLIVGLVLEDLILAAGLFGLVLLTWAAFAPAWLSRALTAAHRKLTRAIALVGLLFGAAVLILLLVVPLLVQLGILT